MARYPNSPAHIGIAGEICTVAAFNDLVEAILNEAPLFDKREITIPVQIDSRADVERMLLHVAERNQPLKLHGFEVFNGEFNWIEAVCKAHRIWFCRSTSAAHGITPEQVLFSPETGLHEELQATCGAYLCVDDAADVLEEQGLAALGELVRKRKARADLVEWSRLPKALVISPEILTHFCTEKGAA